MWLIDQLYIKMGVYLNLGYTILIEQLKIKEAILKGRPCTITQRVIVR